MGLDPTLVHGFQPTQNVGPNLGGMLQDANSMLQIGEQKRVLQQQNALRGILGTPDALDAQGNPTDATLKRVSGVDPAMGMQLRQNMLVSQQRQLQTESMQSKAMQDKIHAEKEILSRISAKATAEIAAAEAVKARAAAEAEAVAQKEARVAAEREAEQVALAYSGAEQKAAEQKK